MPIVNTQTQAVDQADGAKSVTVTMFDQESNVYVQQFWVDPGYDIQARVNAMVSDINEQLAADEVTNWIG